MPFSVRILRLLGVLLLGACALGVAGITWAYLIEPNLLFVRKVDYRVPQWNGRGKPLKVVIAGDLHLMPTAFDEVRALRYVQRIMQLKPDLILLAGDYARGASTNASMSPSTAGRLLHGLKAPYGVFAIQGNHDFTFGWNNWRRELTDAGITVLENQSVLITFRDGRQLQLSGILDTSRNSKKHRPQRRSPDIPHFLLSHRPEADHMLSHGDADIIISGHTHGGQIRLPFDLLWFEASPEHAQPYTYPWHISGGNTYLITKGLGTSTLPSASTALRRFTCWNCTDAASGSHAGQDGGRKRIFLCFLIFRVHGPAWKTVPLFPDDYFRQYQIPRQKKRRPVWERLNPHTGKPEQHRSAQGNRLSPLQRL